MVGGEEEEEAGLYRPFARVKEQVAKLSFLSFTLFLLFLFLDRKGKGM